MHGRPQLDIDNSWNQLGSSEGFTYTECLPLFDEHRQETEVNVLH
jgi:hypothetical protein